MNSVKMKNYICSWLIIQLLFSLNLLAQIPQFPWVQNDTLGYWQPNGKFTPVANNTVTYPTPVLELATLQPYQKNLMYGFKNGVGGVVIPAGYEAVGNFQNGYTWVKLDYKRYYYIDENEQSLINYTFGRAYDFSNGRARVFDKNSTKNYVGYGFIDTTGAVVIPLQYKYAADFVDDYVLVQTRELEWQILDRAGTVLARCRRLKRVGKNGYILE